MKSKAALKIRLSLDLSTDTHDLLETLVSGTDYSKADVVRRSINLLSKMIEAEKYGQSLAVVDGKNRVLTKLLTI